MKENTNGNGAYNVVTTGFGYVNRVREVAPEGAEPYLACDLNLMEGVAKEGDYSKVNSIRMDAIVKGSQARAIVREHLLGVGSDVPVVASVSCGGVRGTVFTYRSGEKAGQTGVALKTALLSIKWLKVGDTVVDLGHEEGGDATAPVRETGQDAAAGPEADEAAAAFEDPAFAAELRMQFEVDGCVKLSRDHPEFDARKAYIKDVMGLRWNRENYSWVSHTG